MKKWMYMFVVIFVGMAWIGCDDEETYAEQRDK